MYGNRFKKLPQSMRILKEFKWNKQNKSSVGVCTKIKTRDDFCSQAI